MKTIRCSECKKEYDYNLSSCPHCGYKNKQILFKKCKRIAILILFIISIFLFILSVKSILNGISQNDMQEYYTMYGDEKAGTIAYYLNKMRFWSMSVCILGIWGGMFLKNKNIKCGKWIKYIFVILFVLFQVLPLFYAISIKGGKV